MKKPEKRKEKLDCEGWSGFDSGYDSGKIDGYNQGLADMESLLQLKS